MFTVAIVLVESWEQCQDADVLLESPSAMAGVHIAEALSKSQIPPFTSSSHIPSTSDIPCMCLVVIDWRLQLTPFKTSDALRCPGPSTSDWNHPSSNADVSSLQDEELPSRIS